MGESLGLTLQVGSVLEGTFGIWECMLIDVCTGYSSWLVCGFQDGLREHYLVQNSGRLRGNER